MGTWGPPPEGVPRPTRRDVPRRVSRRGGDQAIVAVVDAWLASASPPGPRIARKFATGGWSPGTPKSTRASYNAPTESSARSRTLARPPPPASGRHHYGFQPRLTHSLWRDASTADAYDAMGS